MKIYSILLLLKNENINNYNQFKNSNIINKMLLNKILNNKKVKQSKNKKLKEIISKMIESYDNPTILSISIQNQIQYIFCAIYVIHCMIKKCKLLFNVLEAIVDLTDRQ